jgi:hypothetical protein
MNLDDAEQLAVFELAEWIGRFSQLEGWHFMWNKRKRSYGLCRYGQKSIELSSPLTAIETDESAVLNTIRHEIAHALAGPKARHGPIWRQWARVLGCKPRATRIKTPGTPDLPGQYVLVTIVNGQEKVVRTYHRRPSAKYIESLPGRHLRGHPETKGTLKLKRI